MRHLRTTISILLLMLAGSTYAQTTTQFEIVLSEGDSLREAGDAKAALEAYKKIYIKNPKDIVNVYNYACLLSVSRQLDSCFKYIRIAAKLDTNLSILTDSDFLHAMEDKRWDAFATEVAEMVQYKAKVKIKDLAWAKKLWKMKAMDQAYYGDIQTAEKKIGRNSTVVMSLWDAKEMLNEQNRTDLEAMVAAKGWPKISDVGNTGAGAAFLIIQHSDNDKQKKYLPTIKVLCEQKEASWQSYALMYDRIQTHEQKPQRYGSQVRYNDKTQKYELFPLEDEAKVDEWRKDAGMGPLAEYVAHWDIKWEPKKK